MITFDTETCGFHGAVVLIQWCEDAGDIHLYEVWNEPIKDTLELIELFCSRGVIGFNLAFDWFHICKLYTVLVRLKNHNEPPNIQEYVDNEMDARDGVCLKPSRCFDVMLHARKGEYQNTMNREDIRIKKVPALVVDDVIDELNQRIKIKDLYFSRSKNKVRWKIFDIKNDLGEIVPDFKDIVLKFAPSSALKALAQDALNIKSDSILLFADIDIDRRFYPKEYGFAPFAKAVEDKGWDKVIYKHIEHWAYNKLARQYAKKDVEYTRGLYEYFGSPEPNDDDSVLACMVGAVRWRGFAIYEKGILTLKEKASNTIKNLGYNHNSPKVVRKYLEQVLSVEERLVIQGSTKATILEELATWKVTIVCPDCEGLGCPKCDEGLVATDNKHPVAPRAQEVLDARHATKEIELYDKLLKSNRFHASFNVIGALSNRMSGGDGLNAQGIKKTKEVRSCFPLAFGSLELCGGDFDGFEVTIAEAVYHDPKLRTELLTGKKIHALFGQYVYPDMSYDQIIASKDTADDKYMRSKQAVFAMLYGGEGYTLKDRLGVDIDTANEAYNRFINTYSKVGEARREVFNSFCSMRQPNGIGTRVEWHEPADYVESMFGYRRYFTLENKICKTLFSLAEKPPKHWDNTIKVMRRDRLQTSVGATRSALLACAFAIQAANMRAAANHVIQSSGATVTKRLQRRIWDVQPSGVAHWRVQPMNIHDEIMCPTHPEYKATVKKIVNDFIKEMADVIPLIELDWKEGLTSWAGK